MEEALAELERAVEKCLSASVFALSSNDLVGCLDRVQVSAQRLAALQLGLIREADGRGLPGEQGASGTAAWLRERWRVSPSTAARAVRLAAVAGSVAPDVGMALAQGRVNVEQAQVIGAAVAALPGEQHAAGARYLVEQAALFGPRELGRLGQRLFEVVAPEQAQQQGLAALQRTEERAYRDRAVWLTELPGDSRVRLSGFLGCEDAAVLRAALDPLCAPRPDGAGGRDVRSPAQRRADALVEVCRLSMASGQLPDNGGDRPQIVVTIPFAALRNQVTTGMLTTASTAVGSGTSSSGTGNGTANSGRDGSRDSDAANAVGNGANGRPQLSGPLNRRTGVLDDGSELTPAAVRRLACDAAILPAVLSGRGQVLDLGQQRRTFTGPLRRALVLRDGGCRFPGCDRPARWCDGHHIQHWADGGATRLDNAVLLCGHHHRVIHQGHWQVRINPADGHPDFLPPPHLDPNQQARRNTYHQRQ